MRYLGIDWGTKRIGLATSDEQGTIAFPHSVIAGGPKALDEIVALIAAEGVGEIVLGESKDFKNEPNVIMERVRSFKRELEERSGLLVRFEPEFMTSASAARQFAPDGSRKQNPSQEKLDASAAALILQSYLDKNRR